MGNTLNGLLRLTVIITASLGTYNPIPQQDATEYQKHIQSIGPSTNDTKDAPPATQKHIQLNTERIKFWIANGAIPSSRVSWILAKAGVIPHTPTQLQRHGQVNLAEPKSWPVAIKNADGEVIAIMSREDAIEQYKEQNNGAIHPDLEEAPTTRFSFKNVDLQKKVKEPLTKEETLFLLKQVTGI